MKLIENNVYDVERALYGSQNVELINVTFDGPADGESALKEARDIKITNCHFALRYPLWHVDTAQIADSDMVESCRAALWYDKNIVLNNCSLGGIKALRECQDISLADSRINSMEFGWFCKNVSMDNCSLDGEYSFLHSAGLQVRNLQMRGKYSFQYVDTALFEDCRFDTKDAFWHSKNVTVRNSVIKGEYLGWYSTNLTLENCHIVSVQPLCYAQNLRLVNCTMENCNLCFEKSSITATVKGHIDSVKGPYTGTLTADSIGEMVPGDAV